MAEASFTDTALLSDLSHPPTLPAHEPPSLTYVTWCFSYLQQPLCHIQYQWDRAGISTGSAGSQVVAKML